MYLVTYKQNGKECHKTFHNFIEASFFANIVNGYIQPIKP